MQLLYLFEKIRNPVFDAFFSFITLFGEETAFLVVAIAFFWCVSKRQGYFILISGFFGTLINQFMKLLFKVPRPWVIDKNFTIVESAREAATGYSFPSGHTQSAVSTFGAVFMKAKNQWVKYLALAVAILVPISRMYLGVHTPWDVLAAIATAVIILVLLDPLFSDEKLFRRSMPFIILAVTALAVGFYVYAVVINGDNTDPNYVSAAKNARTFMGCTLALAPIYALDRFVIHFKTDAKWYAQILKLAIGLGIVLLIKSVLKSPLEALLGVNERIVRYFLIVIFAGGVWPLTFGLFSKMRIAPLDKFWDFLVSKLSSRNNQSPDESTEKETNSEN